MRVSPTKINISYQNNLQSSFSYQPKIIKSGYIIGQPIAFTNHPILPQDFKAFSPNSSRRRVQSYYNNNQSIIRQYRAPKPTQFPHPDRLSPRQHNYGSFDQQRTVSIQQYNNLLEKYNNLQKKYQILENKYYEQRRQNSNNNQKINNEKQLLKLIEKYKQNTLKQCNLLMDRARLQIKQQQLSNSRKIR